MEEDYTHRPVLMEVDMSNASAEDEGMVCGGSVELLAEGSRESAIDISDVPDGPVMNRFCPVLTKSSEASRSIWFWSSPRLTP